MQQYGIGDSFVKNTKFLLNIPVNKKDDKLMVSFHHEKKVLLAQIASIRMWVLEVEHIFVGSWANQA
jgi:hypothetical protein